MTKPKATRFAVLVQGQNRHQRRMAKKATPAPNLLKAHVVVNPLRQPWMRKRVISENGRDENMPLTRMPGYDR